MKFITPLILIFLVTASVSMAANKKVQKPAVKTTAPAVIDPSDPNKKVVYAENQTLDFEGLSLDGELKAPGEFYFQNRNQERFDSLTKRRVHFRREMLRDSVQSN